MNKLGLALFLTIAGAAHARQPPARSTSASALARYISSATVRPIPTSRSKSPLGFRFATAHAAHPRSFQVIRLTPSSRTAFVPKREMYGLTVDTAYITERASGARRLVGTVKLEAR